MNAILNDPAIIATEAVAACRGNIAFHAPGRARRIAVRGVAPAMREVAGGFRFREAVEVR